MTNAQRELYEALNAHKFVLELELSATLNCYLDERIEATRLVLKWLEQAAVGQPQSKQALRV
jgi:hypothetical protein